MLFIALCSPPCLQYRKPHPLKPCRYARFLNDKKRLKGSYSLKKNSCPYDPCDHIDTGRKPVATGLYVARCMQLTYPPYTSRTMQFTKHAKTRSHTALEDMLRDDRICRWSRDCRLLIHDNWYRRFHTVREDNVGIFVSLPSRSQN